MTLRMRRAFRKRMIGRMKIESVAEPGSRTLRKRHRLTEKQVKGIFTYGHVDWSIRHISER